MRLRNWVACWVASCLLAAGCEIQSNDTSTGGSSKQEQPVVGSERPGALHRGDSVEAQVVGIIASLNKIQPEKIQRKNSFIKDLGLDSLDIVELVMEAEEKFAISISDDEAEKLTTVGQLIDYIKSRLAKLR